MDRQAHSRERRLGRAPCAAARLDAGPGARKLPAAPGQLGSVGRLPCAASNAVSIRPNSSDSAPCAPRSSSPSSQRELEPFDGRDLLEPRAGLASTAPAEPAPTAAVVTPLSGTTREVLSFSAPLVLSTMSMSFMWVVDTAIMGRVGTAEQGAVGLGGTLTWALMCFFAGTMSVVNILTAHDDGAGRTDQARHVRTGLVLVVPMTAVLLALGLVVHPGLGWLGATAEIRPLAARYIEVRLYAVPLWLCTGVVASYLRGLGDTMTPFIVTVVANACNALLAIALVLGPPKMGVAGAGWATAIAQSIEGLLYLAVYLWHPRSRAMGSRSLEPPPLRELATFLRLGLPIGLSWLFEMVAWTAFSAYAGSRPPAELAAHTILFQVTGFCFMPGVALGTTAATLVGRYLGAGRPDIAQASAKRTLLLGCGYMAAMGICIALFRRPLFEAFNPDPAVLGVGATIAFVAAAYQPFDGFGIIGQGILRGAGHTAVPTYLMLGSGLCVFVPLVYLLGETMGLGIVGAWTAALAHVVVVASVLSVILGRGRWQKTALA